MTKIEVIKTSASASLQDKGRANLQRLGVPISGCVDKKMAQSINKLLGNHKNETVLEWAILGPSLKFPKACYIALSHYSERSSLNDESIRALEKIFVPAGSILKLAPNRNVTYQYLAIKGGFQAATFLGSASQLKPYLPINYNDLGYKAIEENIPTIKRPNFKEAIGIPDRLVRIIKANPGPEYALLNNSERRQLAQYHTLSQVRDRMGIQFDTILHNQLESMLSAPVMPGTIQLTSSGKIILLGKDCQTTGGYPRILWLDEKSLATLYQLPSGVKFKFEMEDY